MADGVRLPPVLRRADTFLVSEFALRSGGRVHHAETKAGFGVVPDYYAVDTDPRADAGAIDSRRGHRPDRRTSRDGILHWDAPPGRWRVLRFGASLTGQTNGPAPADSTGLEVDKLDGERVAAYLDTHLARFGDRSSRVPPRASAHCSATASRPARRTGPTASSSTSPRCAATTRCRGCPRSPATSSASAGESDRFLYDYRRTLAELLRRRVLRHARGARRIGAA